MDTDTLATELASREPCCKKRNKLVHLEQLTIQADQGSKVAKESVSAAVTAIGDLRVAEDQAQHPRRREVLA